MTNEERWKAAIEEIKPLLEMLKQVRDKYGLAKVSVRARNYADAANRMAVATAEDDSVTVEVGEAYGMSWYDYEEETLTNGYETWERQEINNE